jgi:hypothetical protein
MNRLGNVEAYLSTREKKKKSGSVCVCVGSSAVV